MATFKVVIRPHDKKKDGTYNIKIRITHNTKVKYKATPFYCDKNDLTKSLKLKNQFLIDETDDLIRAYRKKANIAMFTPICNRCVC